MKIRISRIKMLSFLNLIYCHSISSWKFHNRNPQSSNPSRLFHFIKFSPSRRKIRNLMRFKYWKFQNIFLLDISIFDGILDRTRAQGKVNPFYHELRRYFRKTQFRVLKTLCNIKTSTLRSSIETEWESPEILSHRRAFVLHSREKN